VRQYRNRDISSFHRRRSHQYTTEVDRFQPEVSEEHPVFWQFHR
jgi:hypothetical protein